MQPLQRTAVRSARQLRPHLQRQSRRHASESHGEHHAAPRNESFGAGFFIALAALPASVAAFQYSRSSTDGGLPYYTQLIQDTYAELAEKWQTRNELHTDAVERAASDRLLFLNEASTTSVMDAHRYRFPEGLNTGSPWNVPASSSVDLSEVIAKYEKENYAANEEKLRQLREDDVPAEKPLDQKGGFIKSNPASGGGG